MDPNRFQGILSDPIFRHLDNCALALAENQYFAAAIWGAVFLEAFLDELAGELRLTRCGSDDLQGRIQQLQQYARNPGPGRLSVPDEVIKRCHDVRNTRNRLVHDTGLAKTTLVQDAQFIAAALEVILDWYLTVRPQRPANEEVPVQPGGVPVFVSTIIAHQPRQARFLNAFCVRLRGVGVEPVRLAPVQFDRRDPVGKSRRAIEHCRGAVILGLERSHAYFLCDREGSEQENDVTHRRYSSGWLHLEGGIAAALGLDVFVLCQKDIASDGIFDRVFNSYHVTELPSLDDDSPELAEFFKHLADWAQLKASQGA
jgi:hypothetical protein